MNSTKPDLAGMKKQFCSFADNDWDSDVACYDTGKVILIHVAESRFEGKDKPLVAAKKGTGEWVDQYKLQLAWIGAESTMVDIGLPHDGAHVRCTDEIMAIHRLEQLQDEGYYVPRQAFDALTNDLF